MFNLDGQVALVTGAGRGIGYACAMALAEAGADVAVTGQDAARLATVVSDIEGVGRRSVAFSADLRDVAAIGIMVADVEKTFGEINILVNNAGYNQVEPSFDVVVETWDRIMEVNLRAPFFLAAAVAKGMISRKQGKIVNVASEAGINGLAGHAAYGASKGGLLMLTKDLAVEWGPHNVQVNAVCPGATWTGMTSPAMADPETRESIIGRGVAGRICNPEEVAATVIYLASKEADMVLGHALSIDGGSTAK